MKKVSQKVVDEESPHTPTGSGEDATTKYDGLIATPIHHYIAKDYTAMLAATVTLGLTIFSCLFLANLEDSST